MTDARIALKTVVKEKNTVRVMGLRVMGRRAAEDLTGPQIGAILTQVADPYFEAVVRMEK